MTVTLIAVWEKTVAQPVGELLQIGFGVGDPQQVLDPGGVGLAAAPRGDMRENVKPVGGDQQRHVGFANRDVAREHVTANLHRRIEFANPEHARPDVCADFRPRCAAISVGIHNFASYRRTHLFRVG